MSRIVYGSFQHETNTFAPDKAGWEDFLIGGGWPGLSTGDTVWPALKGSNIPAAGFVQAAPDAGDTVAPTVWCVASPSAHVTEQAYEKISGMIVDGVRAALPVDAAYLDLHGAMVAEHFDDGEGELLRRVRAVIGPDVPLIATLDLHANVTQQMLDQADALVAYRTYPHVDMADTGRRAYALLQERFKSGVRPTMAVRRLNFLISICWQCTDIQPAKGLYQLLEDIEPKAPHVSFATGFPAADFPNAHRSSGLTVTIKPAPMRRPSSLPTPPTQPNRPSLASSTAPMKPCSTPCKPPKRPPAPSSLTMLKTIRGQAVIPTPPACCAPCCAMAPNAPPSV
jgi:microcystin degradation protein MlrC